MRTYGQYCGLARALDHVGQRWTLLVVRELLLGPKRFTDLRRGLPGIATNLLADRLRRLEQDGLVQRRQLPPPAASTVYELTDAGAELREPIEALIRVGGRWMARGPGDDAFRASWLVLALRALGVPHRLDGRLVVAARVDGEDVRLVLADGQVDTGDGLGLGPDLALEVPARLLLGIAAGAVDRGEARGALRSGSDRAELVERLVEALAPPAGVGPGRVPGAE